MTSVGPLPGMNFCLRPRHLAGVPVKALAVLHRSYQQIHLAEDIQPHLHSNGHVKWRIELDVQRDITYGVVSEDESLQHRARWAAAAEAPRRRPQCQ